jgi:hypothetical protein
MMTTFSRASEVSEISEIQKTRILNDSKEAE